MAEKIILPDGGWATIRTAAEVPEKLRRAYLIATSKMSDNSNIRPSSDGKGADVSEINMGAAVEGFSITRDKLILCHVKDWSLEGDVTEEALLELPGGVYDALLDAASKANEGVLLNVDPSQAADPDSPTEPLAV